MSNALQLADQAQLHNDVPVGALVVNEGDEILVITSGGVVMRTPVKEVRETGRDTMGVRLVNLDEGTHVVSLAKVSEED